MWLNNNSKRHFSSGFTLIEVLLALGIFASLAISANQVLRNVITSSVQTEEVGDSLKSLQQLLLIMDSDFRQVVIRSYRNSGQQAPEQMLEMGQGLIESESQGIRFARGGWINPQQLFERGEVVKVGYRIQNDTLERLRWVYPDDSSAYEPAVNPLFEGITSIQFAVSNNGQTWQNSWDENDQMPKAIRVTLETERWGELSRIYLMPTNPEEVVATNNNANSSSNSNVNQGDSSSVEDEDNAGDSNDGN